MNDDYERWKAALRLAVADLRYRCYRLMLAVRDDWQRISRLFWRW